jgi:hypothetical protein
MMFALLSCKSNNSKTNTLVKTPDNNITQDKIDNDLIKNVGMNILNGERIWGYNEKYIFSLMDSLISKNSDSRLFYFKVFGKICEQADGCVGEVIGLYVLKYFELNPSEFIANSKFISDTTFKSMGYNAGVEISMTNDGEPIEVFQNLKTETIEKTKTISDLDKQKLDIFFKQMIEGLESNKK